jgi:hypothetical protein
MLTVGLLFWILYIVGLIFYGYGVIRSREYEVHGLLFWVLFFLLGWKVFGWPISG